MTHGLSVLQVKNAFQSVGFVPEKSLGCKACIFEVSAGGLIVHVRFRANWLTLSVSIQKTQLSPADDHQAWNLCLNSAVPGPAKFFLHSGTGSSGVRVDMFVSGADGEFLLPARIHGAVKSLLAAYRVFTGSNGKASSRSLIPSACDERTGKLCTEAGWDFLKRGSLRVVRLKVPDRLYHAHFEACSHGGYLLVTEMADVTSWGSVSRDALSRMLLILSGSIRLVRPSSFLTAEGAQLVVLETFLSPDVAAADIDVALSALSVACTSVGDAVSLMESERIAREYLACVRRPSVDGNEKIIKGELCHEHSNT